MLLETHMAEAIQYPKESDFTNKVVQLLEADDTRPST